MNVSIIILKYYIYYNLIMVEQEKIVRFNYF